MVKELHLFMEVGTLGQLAIQLVLMRMEKMVLT